ncbi:MAG: hypothetical protein ACSHWU_08165 [Marinicella sp.]
MKIITLLMILLLCSCAGHKVKNSTAIQHDNTFVYYDFFNKSSLTSTNDFNLRLFASRAITFDSRLEQIEYALEIIGYGLSLELSDYQLDKLPPSPYLDINQLMSIKQYLRLAGFNDQTIVVDTQNKLIAYLKTGSNSHNDIVINSQVIVEELDFAHVQETEINDVNHEKDDSATPGIESSNIEVVQFQESAVTTHPIEVDEPIITDAENHNSLPIVNDDFSVSLDMELPSIPDDLSTQDADYTILSNEDEAVSIDLPDFGIPVDSVVGVPVLISIDQGLSLNEIFDQVAQSQNMQYINSMGINAWFLQSTMNHEYEFKGFDHALGLLLGESNRILQSNDIDFLIKASTANNNLEIYYE